MHDNFSALSLQLFFTAPVDKLSTMSDSCNEREFCRINVDFKKFKLIFIQAFITRAETEQPKCRSRHWYTVKYSKTVKLETSCNSY